MGYIDGMTPFLGGLCKYEEFEHHSYRYPYFLTNMLLFVIIFLTCALLSPIGTKCLRYTDGWSFFRRLDSGGIIY